MQNSYWEHFKQTGNINDYLGYREWEAVSDIASEYPVEDRELAEENKSESSNYSNRNDS